MSTSAPAPAPPPGPGVTPPFPAPPIEGRSARLWVRLGIAGLAVLICCGGGVASAVGLVVFGTRAVNEQAQVAVTGYLENLRTGRYAEAYGRLCDERRQEESETEFVNRVDDEPKIDQYDVGDVDITQGIVLPVDVTYRGGRRDVVHFVLVQDRGTGALEVCGVVD